jgi:hypothetical protein
METAIVATNWGGQQEFMTDANSYTLRYSLADIGEENLQLMYGQQWANADTEHLKTTMRYVSQNQAECVAKGKQGRLDMIAAYAPEVVGPMVVARLREIAKMQHS